GGPLDSPTERRQESWPSLVDQMAARQSVPIRHLIPDAEVEIHQPAQREIREAAGISEADQLPAEAPISILRKRLHKFKSLKRGYAAFLLLVVAYVVSFLLPLLVSSRALVVHYN